jgi:predicted nucleic acid-binding protein
LPEWINIRNAADITHQHLLEISLDKGEASAIALAVEEDNCLLIIDELKGRRIAKQLGIRITGTLGLIVEAKLSGCIPSARLMIEKIRKTNFRIDAVLEEFVLKKAGE